MIPDKWYDAGVAITSIGGVMWGNYILVGHDPVAVGDAMQWAKWFETADRHVAKDEPSTGVIVSTVFLGLDHSFGSGPPLLFETMVFGGELDLEQERYSTWDEAVEGHKAMVERVKGRL